MNSSGAMGGPTVGMLCVLLAVCLVVGAAAFVLGFFVGRSAGRRENQQGFPVLPVSPVIPPTPPAPTTAAGPASPPA